MIEEEKISAKDVEQIFFFVDEHSTATNGRYELQEALAQEFKHGTHNYNYSCFYPPIFPALNGISVQFCNSATKTLIRSADIVANKLYYLARKHDADSRRAILDKFYSVEWLP